MARRIIRTIKRKPVKKNCGFCKENRHPDYKNSSELRKYLSERGKILPKSRTGICAKDQRYLAREIKRARHLALLPFVPQIN